jgi:uncharacterized protein YdiU (UPF0061 family)
MADFAFRWNNYDPAEEERKRQQILRFGIIPPDSTGGLSPEARVAPNGQLVGNTNDMRTWIQQGNEYASAQNESQRRAEAVQTLKSLEAQLAEVNGKIALIEKGNSEREIAARALEAGDTSLYNTYNAQRNEIARNRVGGSATIDDMLDNVSRNIYELDWNSMDSKEQKILMGALTEAAYNAERKARDLGIDPNESQRYRKVMSAIADYPGNKVATAQSDGELSIDNPMQVSNYLAQRALNKTLVDSDIQPLVEFVSDKRNENDPRTKEYRALIKEYKGQTKESRASASKRKQDAQALYNVLSDLPREEQTRRIRNLSAAEYKLLEDFYPSFLK